MFEGSARRIYIKLTCIFGVFITGLVFFKYTYLQGNSPYQRLDFAKLRLGAQPVVGLSTQNNYRIVPYQELFLGKTTFDIRSKDVLVFLHVQKTGGTVFERHLMRDLDIATPCEAEFGRKRYKCLRSPTDSSTWIFSRYSTGWKCGLHADWTSLSACVHEAMNRVESRDERNRRYFFMTLLRDPVARFLSEFRHVQRGATWKGAKHYCGGHQPSQDELPPCYTSEDWSDVTFEEFVGCPNNLAFNRQTRMLADLTMVGCYNKTFMTAEERDRTLLRSAKENLRRMSFVGLCEYQRVTQYVFERTFNLRFTQPFVQFNITRSSVALTEVSPENMDRIRRLNYLDQELYEYGKKLLFDRFEQLRKGDAMFSGAYPDLNRNGVVTDGVSEKSDLNSLLSNSIDHDWCV